MLNPLFQAVVEATEESVLNALAKAETMTGINGNRVHAIPYDRLKAAMAKYGRPSGPTGPFASSLGVLRIRDISGNLLAGREPDARF